MDTSKETILSGKEIAVIEKINPIDYGLNADEAKNIEKAFLPKIVERNGLVAIYEQLLSAKITLELTSEAKSIRLKLVKVRTGMAEIHKTQKAYFRAAGLFVDAWKNKETLPVAQMEEKLFEIEDYYPKIERAKLDAVEKSRTGKLQKYQIETEHYDLRKMTDAGFKQLLESSKIAYDLRIAEEEEEAKEFAAEEKRREMEAEKNKKENARLKKEADKREKVIEKARVERKKLQDQLDEKEREDAEEIRLQEERDTEETNATDRVKLERLANYITAIKMPDVESKKAKEVITGVVNLLNKTSCYIKTKALKV